MNKPRLEQSVIMWRSDLEEAPKDGTPIWLWSEDWIDEDYNPTGVMDGYWDENYDDIPGGTWVVAGWNSCHDCYDSFPAADPTMWAHKKSPISVRRDTLP
jgi:hypothetical protein